MEFNEITAELEKFKDSEDFNNYVGGLVTPDRVSKYLETDDGKKIVRPLIDSNFTKGLETWKEKSLPKLIDEEIAKRYPEQDPKDKELANLKAEIDSIKSEKAREQLKNKATKVLNDKKLPLSIVDFILGNDEDTTTSNIEKLSEVFTSHVNSEVEMRLKNNNYIPPKDGDNKTKLTIESIKSMSPSELKERMAEVDEFLKSNK